MNHKNERIKKLWNDGVRDPLRMARKLGLQDTARIIEGLKTLADRGEIVLPKED